jgi:NAD(P) transhydrogenase subunit alpha
MKPGSIIVDLAAPMGGNCPLTEPDKVVHKHGVTIIGQTNMAGHVATDASALFSRNLLNFMTLVYDKDNNKIDLSKDEEITKAITLMDNGKPVHDVLNAKPAAKTTTAKKSAAKKSPLKKTGAASKTGASKTTAAKKKLTTKKTSSKKTGADSKKPTTAKAKSKGN